MKLAFIGFGHVGRGLTEILIRKGQELTNRLGFRYSIVAIATLHRGSVYNANGIDAVKLLEHVDNGNTLDDFPDGQKNPGTLEIIQKSNANVILELTYSNFKDGEPATTYIKESLRAGKHVITSNKGPSLFHHKEIKELARENNLFYLNEGTVLSGTPVINLARNNLAGCTINRIRGIMNGTTNFILSRMETGCDYESAFNQAKKLGYVEADPTADVDGWDAMAKAVILANSLMDANLTPSDVIREGIRSINSTMIQQAKKEKCRWKLIGEVERTGNKFKTRVAPVKLPYSDPLSHIRSTQNAITFDTDLLRTLTIIGPGAGKIETGYSILNDLLEINRLTKFNRNK